MLSGCSQLIWAHSHLIWFLMLRYSQLMWSRKTDVIGSCDLCSRAATLTPIFVNLFWLNYGIRNIKIVFERKSRKPWYTRDVAIYWARRIFIRCSHFMKKWCVVTLTELPLSKPHYFFWFFVNLRFIILAVRPDLYGLQHFRSGTR